MITFTWNGGQNAACLNLNKTLMCIGVTLLTCGIFFAASLVLAALVGVSLVLWNAGTLLLHLATSVVSDNLLVQGLVIILLGSVLVRAIIFFVQSIRMMVAK